MGCCCTKIYNEYDEEYIRYPEIYQNNKTKYSWKYKKYQKNLSDIFEQKT